MSEELEVAYRLKADHSVRAFALLGDVLRQYTVDNPRPCEMSYGMCLMENEVTCNLYITDIDLYVPKGTRIQIVFAMPRHSGQQFEPIDWRLL